MITKVNVNQIFSIPRSNKVKRKHNKAIMDNAPELHAHIVGLYEEGVPLKEIARHFGRSFGYVKKTILKYKACIVHKPTMRDYQVPKLTEPDLLVCGIMFLKAINDKTLNEFFAKVHEVNSITTTYAIDRVPSKGLWWLEVDDLHL